MQNAFIESFNGRSREECLSEHSSQTSSRCASSSKTGGSTTTPKDCTRASTGSPQPSLQPAPRRGITRTDSTRERGHNEEQVMGDKYLMKPLRTIEWSVPQ